jgi:integrase
VIAGFIAHRQAGKVEGSTVNRDLACLRRIFNLAQEWGKVACVLPKVKLLPGENHRERVLGQDEETRYIKAATAVGQSIENDYQRALRGIRALKREQEPRRPDSFLLRDVAIILIDCGLRPEECFSLKWLDNFRESAIEIHTGKGRGSRRRVPASGRVMSILEMRRDRTLRVGVSRSDPKRAHRGIHPEKTACSVVEGVRCSPVCPLHI